MSQNLLDALDGRRDRLRITGLNTISDNPRIFRCDRAYRSPPTASDGFAAFLSDIIVRERPDVILPGRDEDVLLLAHLRESDQKLAGRIPCGASKAVEVMNDKVFSYRFALDRGLPFADTFVVEPGSGPQALAWARKRGFPILSKPRSGHGSHGIRFVCDEQQLHNLLDVGDSGPGLILQEILDFSDQRRRLVDEYLASIHNGVPLFFHIPDGEQFAAETIIAPDGSIGRIFTSRSLMILGRCEKSEPCTDPALLEISRAYAEAISQFGWRGMFNLQCRRADGGFRAHEMNGRMSGSTSARRWFGYDEPRELFRAFCGHDIGADPRGTMSGHGVVHRSLTDDFVAASAMADFDRHGVWTASPADHS